MSERVGRCKAGAAWSVDGLRRFLRLPAAKQVLALEAACALLLARALVLHVPMRYWHRRLDTAAESSTGEQRQSAAAARRVPRSIARAVRKVARRMPFQALCLPQAMAAQWMLRRRRIQSRLVFGVRRGNTPGSTLDFHAWLIVAGACVIGAEEVETFVPLPMPVPDGSQPGVP